MKLGRSEELPLPQAVSHLLEECRMVLPGVQALFGFQLVVVFNNSFNQLSAAEQRLHLAALALVAVAIAFLMAPAAYHRETGPLRVSEGFVTVASRFLLWSMIPLMLAIGLDFYLIARVILRMRLVSFVLAAVLVAVFSCLWFVLPKVALRGSDARRDSPSAADRNTR